jgi:hypothetical protein
MNLLTKLKMFFLNRNLNKLNKKILLAIEMKDVLDIDKKKANVVVQIKKYKRTKK